MATRRHCVPEENFLLVKILLIVFLTLGVEAGSRDNIALGKTTHQSSDGRAGDRAVDGNSDMSGSWCSVTHRSYRPWWVVDFGKRYNVTDLEITSPTYDWNYLSNVDVKVGSVFSSNNFDTTSYTLCHHYAGQLPHGETKVLCDRPTVGRYLSIRRRVEGPLVLCEVKVFSANSTAPLMTTTAPPMTSTAPPVTSSTTRHFTDSTTQNRPGPEMPKCDLKYYVIGLSVGLVVLAVGFIIVTTA